MAKGALKTPEEQAVLQAAELEQSVAQIAVLNRRVSDLAGADADAKGLRESLTRLQADYDQLAAAHAAAVKEAAQANAAARSANQSMSASSGKVAAAEQLARALKELTK